MDQTISDATLGKQRLSKLIMELLWWLVTGIVAWIITQPFWAPFADTEFVVELALFVVVLMTVARYVFLLKYTFLAHFQAMKFILIFISLPLMFWAIQEFFEFRDFYETQSEGMVAGAGYFKSGLSFSERYAILQRLLPLYTFFAWGAIFTVIAMPFRLLVSYWRVYNKTGTV